MDKGDVDELSLPSITSTTLPRARAGTTGSRSAGSSCTATRSEPRTSRSAPSRRVDPDDLLTDEEIDALLKEPENPRDKATIALLADTGLRIGAIASLCVRDVSFEGPTAIVTINEEANVKGASGTVPLTWSEGYVTSWLDVHPRRVFSLSRPQH